MSCAMGKCRTSARTAPSGKDRNANQDDQPPAESASAPYAPAANGDSTKAPATSDTQEARLQRPQRSFSSFSTENKEGNLCTTSRRKRRELGLAEACKPAARFRPVRPSAPPSATSRRLENARSMAQCTILKSIRLGHRNLISWAKSVLRYFSSLIY